MMKTVANSLYTRILENQYCKQDENDEMLYKDSILDSNIEDEQNNIEGLENIKESIIEAPKKIVCPSINFTHPIASKSISSFQESDQNLPKASDFVLKKENKAKYLEIPLRKTQKLVYSAGNIPKNQTKMTEKELYVNNTKVGTSAIDCIIF